MAARGRQSTDGNWERTESLLRALAVREVRARGLPEDLVDDLVSEAYVRLFGEGRDPPTSDEAQAEVRRIARAWRQRERRDKAMLAEIVDGVRIGPPRSGVPPLCPGLASLASLASRSSDSAVFERALLAAASTIAEDQRVIDAERHWLFIMAYVKRRELDEIVLLMNGPARRVVQKRLRRLSRRLEKLLLDRMRSFTGEAWPALVALVRDRGPGSETKKNKKTSTPVEKGIYGVAYHALQAVSGVDPGPTVS